MNLRILATKNSWCVHISWRNSWNKYFYFCRCWLFLNKWNNEILVTNIALPNNFNSSHRGSSPNVRKTSASTKFWQISKLSPPPSLPLDYNGSIFFNFWYHSQVALPCSKQWKHEFLKYVKYAWKPMYRQNLLKANNKSTITRWLILFWCLHNQLQRCGYSETKWTSTIQLCFCNSIDKS